MAPRPFGRLGEGGARCGSREFGGFPRRRGRCDFYIGEQAANAVSVPIPCCVGANTVLCWYQYRVAFVGRGRTELIGRFSNGKKQRQQQRKKRFVSLWRAVADRGLLSPRTGVFRVGTPCVFSFPTTIKEANLFRFPVYCLPSKDVLFFLWVFTSHERKLHVPRCCRECVRDPGCCVQTAGLSPNR